MGQLGSPEVGEFMFQGFDAADEVFRSLTVDQLRDGPLVPHHHVDHGAHEHEPEERDGGNDLWNVLHDLGYGVTQRLVA